MKKQTKQVHDRYGYDWSEVVESRIGRPKKVQPKISRAVIDRSVKERMQSAVKTGQLVAKTTYELIIKPVCIGGGMLIVGVVSLIVSSCYFLLRDAVQGLREGPPRQRKHPAKARTHPAEDYEVEVDVKVRLKN